jgi:hypothetical protein
MERDQKPGPTTASLHKHMLEADLADMVARQYLQPIARGKERTKTNNRFHRTKEMAMVGHTLDNCQIYSEKRRLESFSHQAKRKTHKHLAQNLRYRAPQNKDVMGRSHGYGH